MEDNKNVRSYNIGSSDYSKHKTQPWDIWEEYRLNPWDADIVKRILRKKTEPGKTVKESRIEDYQKIIHICEKRIDMLKNSDYDDIDIAVKEYIKEFGKDKLMEMLTGKSEYNEPHYEEIPTEEVDSIMKGDRFLCIKDVIMDDEELAYKKWKIYESQAHEAITDEQGYIGHYWNLNSAKQFFRKITKP